MHATLVLFQFGTTSRFLEKSHGNAVMNHEAFIYTFGFDKLHTIRICESTEVETKFKFYDIILCQSHD